MQLSELCEHLDRACDFPIDHETLVTRMNDVEMAAQNGEATKLASVLDRADATDYRSVAEAHHTILANLDEAHIGRKHYDDRSSAGRQEEQLSL